MVLDAKSSTKPMFFSPPRVPPRGQTPEKPQKHPTFFLPVEPAPVIVKNVDKPQASEATSSQEIAAPRLHWNQKQNDLKLSAPKLRIDPEVVVQKPVKVPAVAREPIKEVVPKVVEVQNIVEVKVVAKKVDEVKELADDAKKIKTADTEMKFEAKKPEAAKIPPKVVDPSVEAKTSEKVKSLNESSTNASESSKKVSGTSEPSRMMYSDLKKFEWSADKNINVKIITMLETNIFTLCEVREAMDEYYKYIDDAITKYCKEAPDIAQSDVSWFTAQFLIKY